MPEASSRIRRAAQLLALVLLGLLAALVLGELAVRATWEFSMPAGERAQRPQAADLRRSLPATAPDLPVYRSLWDLGQVNANGSFKGLPYRTNSAGIRGPEYSERPAPGVFRIVVGGDSVTMGSGVLEEEAYPALLERALNAAGNGRRYEVLNLGLAGSNTPSVVDRIRRIGLSYHPDLIVYGYTLNDIEGPAYVSTIPPGAVKAKRERFLRFADSSSYLLRAVWPRALSLWELLAQPRGTLKYDYRTNYFENSEAWGSVTDGLDQLARMGDKNGVCVLVLIHTGIAQLNMLFPFVDVMERVEEASRERGLAVTRTLPYFEGRDPTSLRISFFDTHPNAAGHEILARALRDGLAALPERCWQPRRP